jgi:hypothetical protein
MSIDVDGSRDRARKQDIDSLERVLRKIAIENFANSVSEIRNSLDARCHRCRPMRRYASLAGDTASARANEKICGSIDVGASGFEHRSLKAPANPCSAQKRMRPPRRPSSTTRIFSSAAWCFRGLPAGCCE